MAKGSRGGRRGGVSVTSTAGTSTGTSAGASAKASANAQNATTSAQTASTQAGTASAPNNPTTNTVASAGAFTDADAQAFVDAHPDLNTDADYIDARRLYISKATDSSGFSMSQNLNYKLDNNMPLSPSEQFIDDNIQYGMRPIGKDAILTRYAHDDVLKGLGVQNYQSMTDSQLQSALVGTEFQTTSYMSTSYDGAHSPFAPNQPQGGGREVTLNIKAGSNTNVVLGAKNQKEVVINRGTNFRVTGIHRDGTTAYPRLGGAKDRVVIDIETF